MKKTLPQIKHRNIQQSNMQSQNPLVQTQPETKLASQPASSQKTQIKEQEPKKERLQSLDIYRGFTLFGMLLVDHVGPIKGCFYWLNHVDWDGFTTASLVLPSFLYIMGIAIPFSIKETRPVQAKNIKRIIFLFLIGAILNLIGQKFYIKGWRIPGILQTLSVCYGVVLFVHWITDYGTNSCKRLIGGLAMLGLVVIHTLSVLLWEDPQNGCFKPCLTPYCNFCRYVDMKVFTQSHMLGPTDGSGIFQYLNQSVTTYCGYLFGIMLIKFKDQEQNFLKFGFGFALLCGVLVYPFSLIIPINKALYTVSFLLVVLAFSGAAFTFFFLIFDYIPKRTGKKSQFLNTLIQPFVWLGMNSLVIYLTFLWICIIFFSYIDIGGKHLYTYLYGEMFSPWVIPEVGSIIYAFIFLFVYIMVARTLYRKKIFVSL